MEYVVPLIPQIIASFLYHFPQFTCVFFIHINPILVLYLKVLVLVLVILHYPISKFKKPEAWLVMLNQYRFVYFLFLVLLFKRSPYSLIFWCSFCWICFFFLIFKTKRIMRISNKIPIVNNIIFTDLKDIKLLLIKYL